MAQNKRRFSGVTWAGHGAKREKQDEEGINVAGSHAEGRFLAWAGIPHSPKETFNLKERGNTREGYPELRWAISTFSQRSFLLHSIPKIYRGWTILNQIPIG